MFHNNNKKALKTALSVLLISSTVISATANAAVYTPEGRSVVYKTSLADIEGLNERVLDWRNPSIEFTFDASDTDWTDGLELLLSADPMGNVSAHTPLMVQFNNGKPTPVATRGKGFDARIKLEAARIRPRNNKIRFTYNTPVGENCLAPQHGGWRLDFKNSLVIIKARAKIRNLDINEINEKLLNPTTAPKSVRLLARGANTAKLEVLAAQGMGLRMTSLPEFKTTGGGDFEVVLARRDQLYGTVSDEKILNGTGPRIMVHKGRPMRLVITGDTDAEVLSSAKAFATHQLPTAHRPSTSPGELNMQMPLSASNPRIDGTVKLSDLDSGYFENSWGPRPQRISFNVNDPTASTGELLLRISSDDSVSDKSRISVNLNGNSLGFSALNKSRKSVAFKIPAGALKGTDNVLSITPELEMHKLSGCNFTQTLPGLHLGNGSKLIIKTATPSPVAELSKMTASGAPFSVEKAANTVVMLPASSARDYNASLKIMAKLAKSSGHGWTEANYLRSSNLTAIGNNKNVLFIGPNSGVTRPIKDGAPKGLTSALKGQVLNGTGRIASIDRFASNDERSTMRLYAQRQAEAGRIRNGGVAALYPSPMGNGTVMGIITNVPGRSFSSVASDLIKPHAWNNMEGSVARWNNSKVIMAQTAMAVPGFIGSAPKPSGLNTISFPDINWPQFDMSRASETFENLKTSGASLVAKVRKGRAIKPKALPKPTLKPAMTKKMKTAITAVPKLRGMSKVPVSKKTTGTRTANIKKWAANTSSSFKQGWQKINAAGSLKDAPSNESMAQWQRQKFMPLAIMLTAALSFLFLLLALVQPARNPHK